MREIKFRAWDKDGKKMVFDVVPFKTECWHYVGLTGEHGYLENFKIMQYTGLKDKNETEIYEGDVVDCGMREGKSEVVFFNGSFGYYRPTTMGRTFTTNCYDSLSNCEIIGNIYETPTLSNTSGYWAGK